MRGLFGFGCRPRLHRNKNAAPMAGLALAQRSNLTIYRLESGIPFFGGTSGPGVTQSMETTVC